MPTMNTTSKGSTIANSSSAEPSVPRRNLARQYTQFSMRVCACALRLICRIFSEVKGRFSSNRYWKLTIVPHCCTVPAGFNTTERQIVTLLLVVVHPPPAGIGGLGVHAFATGTYARTWLVPRLDALITEKTASYTVE